VRFTIGALVGIILGALLVIGTIAGFIAGVATGICSRADEDKESTVETPEEVTVT